MESTNNKGASKALRKLLHKREATTLAKQMQIRSVFVLILSLMLIFCLSGCAITTFNDKSGNEAKDSDLSQEEQQNSILQLEVNDKEAPETLSRSNAETLRASLGIKEDYRASFVHGEKPASCQKYIMLHDTEGNNDAASVISGWDNNGNLVAAHFVVNKDGTIWQCVPLDKIAHHAGFGDTGHNAQFGVGDESRDDKKGTVSIGSSFADYGMNSWSVGIEIVHVGGSGDYPEAQLVALDNLIAYIDAYYGFESQITDHKAWRSGNSDTSAEFATYLANYKSIRKHA